MSILSAYRYVELGSALDKLGTGITAKDASTLALFGANVGWNYFTVSCIILLVMLGYSMLLGYNRNPGGLIALVIMNIAPAAIGSFYNFTFFTGYGTSHLLPLMTIFNMQNVSSKAQQVSNSLIFCGVVCVLIIIAWLIGRKIRSIYAAKYEIEFD
jgi:bacteriorhodopsin